MPEDVLPNEPQTTDNMTEEYFAYREPAAVGVSFRRSGKVYYFRPNGLRVRQGDQVLAETDKGLDLGEVVFVKYEAPELEEGKPLKTLLRRATPQDVAKEEELRLKEREARRVCEEKIAAHNLPMRLIAADYTFDGQRLIFFFSAESRVDFRALVRDLAETFKTRIELRQVGVRDQAKMIGGLGPCGRPLCCNSFLRNFDPVGIRVAKDQGLSLNPAKISGICDRLMCCLKFEHETYCELAKKLPKAGQTVNTARGQAVVKSVNLMHERIQVQHPDGDTELLKACHVWALGAPAPECACPCKTGETAETRTPPPAEGTAEMPAITRRSPRGRRSDRPTEGEAPRGRREERSRPERPERGRRSAAPAGEVAPAAPSPDATAAEGATSSRRRRRRRPDRKRRPEEGAAAQAAAPTATPTPQPPPTQPGVQAPAGEGRSRRRRSRFRPRRTDPGPPQG